MLHNKYKTKCFPPSSLFVLSFLASKMQERDDSLDHVNKVKALEDHFIRLEAPVRDDDFIMTLSTLYQT